MFEIELLFAFALFGVGLYGISSKNDFLRIFFSLEMLLNSVILILASSANHLGMTQNLALAYVVIVIATLEAAAGILIFILANQFSNKIIPDEFNEVQNND